ncbi:peptide/nickel transport system substrate-binding protein [Stella humosa]|uniref:Peptide/nickel transport system substrate-binding protein n=1 Tax=Stella humosa TaxID=94 RepID=A0A3N1KVG0_9PROT|nr:ABC transporter substrate-binding protein [Stella humosa]ROP84571.1 peptide/nickel transport system substrate-binding protein [Stella humosa]
MKIAASLRAGVMATAVVALATFQPTPVAAQQASPQQTVRVGIHGADIGSLDPHMSAQTIDNVIHAWIYGGLVRFPAGTIDPTRIEPDIAESWTKSPDGLVWTFVLRPGVKFHGGYGEVTADDVVHSLKRAGDPKTSTFASDFASFDKVEAVDPRTVRITLKTPVPSLLGLVTAQRGGYVVSRKADQEAAGQYTAKAIGTGPFQLEEYRSKQFVALVANPDYFRGRPKVDRVVYRFIPANESRDLAFRAGELDLFYGRKEQRWVDRMKATPGLAIEVFGPGELRLINLNTSMKPFDDIRVRRAVAHAINRADFVKFVGADVVSPNPSVVPLGYLGYTDQVERFAYDPEKSKQLLKEAGHPNGITIKVLGSNRSFVEPYQLLQAQLAKAGITMELQLVEHTAWHAQIRQNLSAMVVYTAARFPVADIFLTQFFHSASAPGKPTAVTNFSHCDVADREIDAARIEQDPKRQLELWHAAQQKIVANVCAVPLFDEDQVWGRSTKLEFGHKLEASISFGPMLTEQTVLK